MPGVFIEASLRNLVIDRATVEVSRAFAASGIPSIVLKGPAIANWLYDRDEVRAYGDTDLLIPRSQWERAGHVLGGLGFVSDLHSMAHPRMESFASDPWVRNDVMVDLHSTLHGLGANLDTAWGVMRSHTVPMEIAGAELLVLDPPARAMHVALHAAQHQDGKAVLDLERGVARLSQDLWLEAAQLAATLDALPAFAAGLRLTSEGTVLASALGVRDARSVKTELRHLQVPVAEGLAEISTTPGLRSKIKLLASEIFPSAAFMRWWSPLARRGPLGLAIAYLWRPVWLALRTPSALRTVRRARRAAGPS